MSGDGQGLMDLDSFIFRAMRAQAAEYGPEYEERERQAQEAFLKACENLDSTKTITVKLCMDLKP